MIIGIAGAAEVGKSTTARQIINAVDNGTFRSHIVPFADPVKHIATTAFGWDGIKDERGRKLLQKIGTDVGRWYNPNIWAEQWAVRTECLATQCDVLIADDVRFQNEVDVIRSLGGFTVRLTSATRGRNDGHASEKGDFEVDFTVNADVPPEQVAAEIIKLMDLHQEKCKTQVETVETK